MAMTDEQRWRELADSPNVLDADPDAVVAEVLRSGVRWSDLPTEIAAMLIGGWSLTTGRIHTGSDVRRSTERWPRWWSRWLGITRAGATSEFKANCGAWLTGSAPPRSAASSTGWAYPDAATP